MQLLRLLPLLPLCLPQEPAGAPAPLAEPAQRYRLTVGTEAFELEEGRPVTPRPDGPTYRLELLPTRILRVPGAFSFEYPRAFAWSGALGEHDGWCSLSGAATTLHLQRHGEDPAAVVERYVQSAVACGAHDVRDASLVLDGRTLAGRAFDQHVGGFHGWEGDIVQEVYGFQQGGSGWLLMLQRSFETTGPTGLEPILVQLGAPAPRWPSAAASSETESALELLRASFRFERD